MKEIIMTNTPRKGDWIQTFTGRQYWPLDPREQDVSIRDIAHALSHNNRFTGHTFYAYSVAQHSVLGSYLLERLVHQRQFLLHDATEAYIADIARPLKRHLANYIEIEDLNWNIISNRFGVSRTMYPEVKQMDNDMLLAEREQIMRKTDFPWSVDGKAAQVTIERWSPEEAQLRFLQRYVELFHE
jgi:hypothetical protein